MTTDEKFNRGFSTLHTDDDINLTPHLPLPRSYRLGLTKRGLNHAQMELASRGQNPPAIELCRLIASSAHAFLTSEWMRRSLWFKSQTAHAFDALAVMDAKSREINFSVVLHLVLIHDLKYASGAGAPSEFGWLCVAPEQCVLAENYPDKRVIEEVKVQYL